MLAPILAAIIIILLIIYAAYPFLVTKGFKGWANIILTALILFTVIVTLFVILGHQKGNRIRFRTIPTMAEESAAKEQTKPEAKPLELDEEDQKQEDNQNISAQETKTNPEEISDEEALMEITKEYLEAEEAFKAQGHSDYQQRAAQQIIDKYDFTKEDWQTFLEDAARNDLFNKAKAEMK